MKKINLENAVIEIEEVEYLITKQASEQIEKKIENIELKRLIDHKNKYFSLKLINKVIKEGGIVDHLTNI